MAKLVDAHDSGSCEEILGGSNPPIDKYIGKIFPTESLLDFSNKSIKIFVCLKKIY